MAENQHGFAHLLVGREVPTLAALALLSSVLLRAWFTLAVNLQLAPNAFQAPWESPAYLVAFFGLPVATGRFLLTLGVYRASRRIEALGDHRWIPRACCVLLLLGAALAASARYLPAIAPFALVFGGLALSIGYETYALLWYELFAKLGFTVAKRLIICRIGFDAGAALLWFLPLPVSLAFCVLAPLGALVGFEKAGRGTYQPNASTPARRWLTFEPQRSTKLALGIFLLCMGFAFMQSAFQGADGSPFGSLPAETAAFFVGRFATLLIMIVSLRALRDLRFDLMIRISVMAAIVGFLFLLLPFEYSFFAFCAAVVVSAFMVEYAVVLMTIYVASYTTAAPIRVIAWGQLIMRAAGIPTILLGLTLSPHIVVSADSPVLPYVVAIAVGLLMIVGMWLIDERGIGTFLWGRGAAAGQPQAPAETAESKAVRLATAYQLTEREAEIAQMLLEGRTVPFIKESLYLSANTVKTHVRHIYQKTGVHNRQELIDKTL